MDSFGREMPTLNPEQYSADVANMVRRIQGRGGRLRSSKPKGDGEAAYVWRMVAFQISPVGAHQCMPVTADFDIKERDYKARRAITNQLDEVVKQIVDGVPRDQWYGVRRWGRAFGYC